MLISTAYAQGTGLSGIFDNQSALMQFLPLVLIFVVFYFLLIRPQQRKAKDHRTTLDALRRGDRVVTGGGIIGTVVRVDSPDEVASTSPTGCGCASCAARSRACSPSPTRPLRARRPSRRSRRGPRRKPRSEGDRLGTRALAFAKQPNRRSARRELHVMRLAGEYPSPETEYAQCIIDE